MASIPQFVERRLRMLHDEYDRALDLATEEQLYWRPLDRGNHTAFNLWHYVRTEDNLIQFVFQRKPTVWLQGGYHERFGLDPKAQGTGMSPVDAAALRLPPKDQWREYQQQVWAATRDFLGSMTEEQARQKLTVKPLGEMALIDALGQVVMTHGFTHLGEVWHLLSLQGVPGSPV